MCLICTKLDFWWHLVISYIHYTHMKMYFRCTHHGQKCCTRSCVIYRFYTTKCTFLFPLSFLFLPHNCNGINNIKVVSCNVTLANSIITFFWNLKGWTIMPVNNLQENWSKEPSIYNWKFEIFFFVFVFVHKEDLKGCQVAHLAKVSSLRSRL